jgi:pyruvate dehydrogenase E2 component (dihydrolipoamide acetyltransferase)
LNELKLVSPSVTEGRTSSSRRTQAAKRINLQNQILRSVEMAYEFRFPDVGSGITEGEVVKWHVKEGDAIKEDQVLVEIETDKSVVEVPSPRNGCVLKRNVSNEGQKIKVGDIIVVIGEKGEKYVPGKAISTEINPTSAKEVKKDAGILVGKLPDSIISGQFAMPAVRKLAKELRVNLSSVTGTGPGGRITEADVRNASGQPAASTPVAAAAIKEEPQIKVTKKYDFFGMVRRESFKGVRKATADKMSVASSKAAIVTNFDEADITDLAAFREGKKQIAEQKGIKLTFLPFVLKAVVESLKKQENQSLNCTLDEPAQEIVFKDYYNIGFAISTEAGLMVPVIKGAGMKDLMAIAKEIQDLSEKARSRKIDTLDLQGGTFTISNLGSIGGIFFTPIINFPESAILGLGRIIEKPVVKDGKIVARKILPLSISYDHRLVDGSQAATFLNSLKSLLENPADLTKGEKF